MILEMEVEGIKIPYAQYAINENQIINVLPLPPEVVKEIKAKGFKVAHWGSLTELNLIMRCQCQNSLYIDAWDFAKYPNPEILIMTKKE